MVGGDLKRISNNEPAGLIYSEDSSGKKLTWEKYHKFAGIDCSGFVSNLWGISKKNTSMLLDFSDRIGTMSIKSTTQTRTNSITQL